MRIFQEFLTQKQTKFAEKIGAFPIDTGSNNSEISLTYDNDYAISVSEIIAKAMSGDYEEIMLEIQSRKNLDGYKVLLPEIAELLNISVSFLKSRPDEVQDGICKAYVNLWYCDTDTIKRELSDMLKINFSVEHDVEKQRKTVEIIPQNHVPKERSYERERRF